MNRREFLFAVSAAPLAGAAPARITRIRVAPIQGRFHKFVTMNSYDTAPKGHTYSNTLVRIETDQGVEGVGVMSYSGPNDAFYRGLKTLIGADPLSLYSMENGRITGRAAGHAEVLARFRHLDGPLFDLIGKLTSRPVWKLIGDAMRERIEVYDGTLYFSDVWFRDRGVRAVVEEAEEAARSRYRGIKLKVGRGSKWMEKDAGLQRDIEVVRAVRKAVGPQMKIMADPNDGFRNDLERAWRFVAETADAKLYWLEEPFPESVAAYTELKNRIEKAGLKTLIADGEGQQQPAAFEPYLSPRVLMDVLQLDIRTAGIVDNLALAHMAAPRGAHSVPHNWGSQVGVLTSLHFAKAVGNALGAEDDRSTCDVIVPHGYELRDGFYTVPDTPGLSISVDEQVYKQKCTPKEFVVS